MLREDVTLNADVLKAYETWLEDHPFEQGEGWAAEPWSQEEMPLDATLVQQAALDSDVALIMIGRTAGEDRDNTADPGSYFLTETEQEMLRLVTTHFKQTVVVLNVGNIIDMRWVEETTPSAVLYAWQGGMEGGTGLSDLLLGRVSPSGKLQDTIVHSMIIRRHHTSVMRIARCIKKTSMSGTVTSRRSHRKWSCVRSGTDYRICRSTLRQM